jgi:hypothetical protein
MNLLENTTLEVSDITAWDQNEQKLLVSKVRARDLEEDLPAKVEAILKSEYEQNQFIVPYAMTATRQNIDFYGWDGKTLEPLYTFSTPEVLSVYEPEFTEKRILEFYLETLLESWLRDLAYHWKTENPPKYEELAKVGFVQKLADAD